MRKGLPGVRVVTQEGGVLMASELSSGGAWSEPTKLNLLPKSKSRAVNYISTKKKKKDLKSKNVSTAGTGSDQVLSYQKQYGSWSEIQAESQVWRARLKCQHLGGKVRRPMPNLGPGLSI